MSHHPALAFGTFCSIGGIYGFMKTNSKPSLAGGLVLGSLYFASAYQIKENKNNGVEMALGTSVFLTLLMAKRAFVVKSPVARMMFSVGVVGCSYYGYKLYRNEVGY
jgi:uncharacterized membrane protein (UPF0136 family)